jgi:hypothetical protein
VSDTSAVGIPASCSLIIPIIWASVKRLCSICLLLRRLSKLYIKVRDVSGGRSRSICHYRPFAAIGQSRPCCGAARQTGHLYVRQQFQPSKRIKF